MRVRIKFTKNGALKFIGHLDVMRFFQKVLRRAGIDVAYSEGFSPHMLMSFAQPLGVCVTSEGEYFDLDLKSAMPSKTMLALINEQMPPEMSVTEIVKIPEDKANKCMTLVAAADYVIRFKEEKLFQEQKKNLEDFFAQKEIVVLKKTKRSEQMMDIRPLIYEAEIGEESISLKLSSGSVNNVKPRLLMDAFCEWAKLDPAAFGIEVHRKELYARVEEEFIPLYKLGEEIY